MVKNNNLSFVNHLNIISFVVVQLLSCVWLFEAPWTIACQASLSMGSLRQEYWSGLPFSSPGYLPKPGIKPASPELAGRFFTTETPGKPINSNKKYINVQCPLFVMASAIGNFFFFKISSYLSNSDKSTLSGQNKFMLFMLPLIQLV